MIRPALTLLLVLVAAFGAGEALGARGSNDAGILSLSVPAVADGDTSVDVEFSLPGAVAAVDGRLLLNTSAAEIVGVAPVGGGTALAPQPIPGGAAFGAY